ncbi:MAG: hypothetical protein IT201_09095 [Thermoleophilia bacterium]|nr:hypothetical protein [Thermoleophilia bacterium]
MSPVDRELAPAARVFDLRAERERTDDPALVGEGGRNARTLLKDGPLRVTLVVVGPGGSIAEHGADGPATLQPLDGRIRVAAVGREHELGPDELLTLGAGVRHSVASTDGAAFLLTIALPSTPARA